MKLIYSVPSPYARKARIVLIEARLEGRVETEAIDPWSDPLGFRDDNPLGKVPTLIRDDRPGTVPVQRGLRILECRRRRAALSGRQRRPMDGVAPTGPG